MKLNTALLSSLSIAIIMSTQYANATDPESWPDGRGGWTTELKGEHFYLKENAELEQGNVVISRIGAIQRGCAFISPEIPVFHEDGYADITLKLNATWSGFIDVNRESDADLFRVSVVTISDAYARRAYMHTGLMYKKVDYIGDNGVNHYIAKTWGWKAFNINRVRVRSGDHIWFKVCDVRGGTTAQFSEATIHTYPTGQ